MFKNRDPYGSMRDCAVGVILSIMGAVFGVWVVGYWLMVHTEQFEVLVLTPAGEVNSLAMPWLAALLYVLGALIRWTTGERIVVPHALIKLLVWPGKYCGIIHTLPAMGWQSVGSSGLVGLWMRQHDLDWCVVAYRHSDMSYKTKVVDYLDLDKLDSRAYWVHEPLAPLDEITPETQRVILESQLNKRLTDLS